MININNKETSLLDKKSATTVHMAIVTTAATLFIAKAVPKYLFFFSGNCITSL